LLFALCKSSRIIEQWNRNRNSGPLATSGAWRLALKAKHPIYHQAVHSVSGQGARGTQHTLPTATTVCSRREQYVLPRYGVRFSRERARRLVRCCELEARRQASALEFQIFMGVAPYTQRAQDARREKHPPPGIYFSSSPATTPDALSSTFGIDLGFNILYKLAVITMWAHIVLLRLRKRGFWFPGTTNVAKTTAGGFSLVRSPGK
jgi:hypothetical protein